MEDLKMREKLRDVPTGVMLDVILGRARLAMNYRVVSKDGAQKFHWQWCRMLEGSVFALLNAIPQNILNMTDNELPRPQTNRDPLQRLMAEQPIPKKPKLSEINETRRKINETRQEGEFDYNEHAFRRELWPWEKED